MAGTWRAALGVVAVLVAAHLSATRGEGAGVDFDFAGRGTVEGVEQLAARVLGTTVEDVRSKLEMEIVGGTGHLRFAVEDTAEGRVRIVGTAGPDVTYGLARYLRAAYGVRFSWNRTGGNQVGPEFREEKAARPIGSPLKRRRNAPISYFGNVVTFSYSYVWYQFHEWEALLDWMALNGINVAIAFTGQEEIYRKTFARFGVSDDEFSQWCNGIAYLAWARGQNLHGCAGGLPLKVMRAQWSLQKQILARMRELGIAAVLPAFQGNVPASLRAAHPEANFSRSGIAWLDGTDPLFKDIQRVFLETMIQDWGTDHWYEADGYFNHESGPWLSAQAGRGNDHCRYNVDPTEPAAPVAPAGAHRGAVHQTTWSALRRAVDVDADPLAMAHSSAVFASMQAVDPRAVWLYQGWIWRGWGGDRLAYMKGFVEGIPRGRFVLLDMFDEVDPEWSKFDDFAYFGTPFIWSSLHNFGGNTGMWGSLELLNRKPFDAFQYAPLAVAGVGAAPEGIDQNPVYYDMLFDVNWQQGAWPSVQDFLESWARERYGVASEHANKAWRALEGSVYGGEQNDALARRLNWLAEKNADGVTAKAFGSSMSTPGADWFDLDKVVLAWEHLVAAVEGFGSKPAPQTLQYDLVNVGREALAKRSNALFSRMVNASMSTEQVAAAGAALLQLGSDLDKLLCTVPSFQAKPWFDMAAALARSIDPADEGLAMSFAHQARSQTTTWGPQVSGAARPDSQNLDYANKQWGGQVAGFYALRHKCFLGSPRDRSAYDKCVVDASVAWVNDLDNAKFPMCLDTPASAASWSRTMLRKWFGRGFEEPLAEA